ncbi:acyl-CoA dehydrogenase family protein [Actinocrispum sp. NPDC049592]|uniref:acyl-CoA dehydrogenase family protein n=1 Tax=Actinocrispum sp. NPDC049592 TaxID=3154835 RepID=UPI0034455E2E
MTLPSALTEAIERIGQRAPEADAEAVFPSETVADLAGSGLLRAMVPRQDGGLEFTDARFCAVAMSLGAACLSTAYVWVMHCQQADLVFRHGSPLVRKAARKVIEDGGLLCSVTTERPGPDTLFPGIDAAVTALVPGSSPGSWWLRREAPVVSAARHAQAFLVTAGRRDSDAVAMAWVPTSAVVGGQAGLRKSTPLTGMRATENRSLVVAADGDEDLLIGGADGFRGAAKARWSRLAHLGWSASWVGAAAQVVEEATGGPARKRFARRQAVGTIPRASLAATVWELESVTGALLRHQRELPGETGSDRVDEHITVRSNLLKAGASETCFRVVDRVVADIGAPALVPGSSIERHWRDLRMAALVTRNDALLVSAGSLLSLRAYRSRPLIDQLWAG